MHNAPSVTYPVRPSNRVRLMLMAVWALGAAGVAAWCFQADGMGARQLIGLAALVLTAALVYWASVGAPIGNLRWDGQYWSLDGDRPVGTAKATVHLDFQSLVLLSLTVDRSVRWLWLDRQSCPERWRAVRRALFARSLSTDTDAAGLAPSGAKASVTITS